MMTTPAISIDDEQTAEATSAAPADVARAFLAALSEQDWPRLRGLLADDVWMRALLTSSVDETHDADTVTAALRTWHGDTNGFVVLDLAHDTIERREHLRYRFAERPSWAPDQWHVIEQTGYLRVREGRISRLDLVCTGYHPVGNVPPANAAPASAGV